MFKPHMLQIFFQYGNGKQDNSLGYQQNNLHTNIHDHKVRELSGNKVNQLLWNYETF